MVIKKFFTRLPAFNGTMTPLRQRSGMLLLYMVLVIAAIAVIILSVIGIAVMTGTVPGIQSPEASVSKSMRR